MNVRRRLLRIQMSRVRRQNIGGGGAGSARNDRKSRVGKKKSTNTDFLWRRRLAHRKSHFIDSNIDWVIKNREALNMSLRSKGRFILDLETWKRTILFYFFFLFCGPNLCQAAASCFKHKTKQCDCSSETTESSGCQERFPKQETSEGRGPFPCNNNEEIGR